MNEKKKSNVKRLETTPPFSNIRRGTKKPIYDPNSQGNKNRASAHGERETEESQKNHLDANQIELTVLDRPNASHLFY